MSDAELMSPTLHSDSEHDHDASADTNDEADNVPITEIHEDVQEDVIELQPSDPTLVTEVEHVTDTEPAAAATTGEAPAHDAHQEAVAVATPIKQQAKAVKLPSSTKSPARKSAKSPVPLVKKVISSGTFGSGSIKPSPPVVAKAATTSPSKQSSSTPLSLRKTSSTAGSVASKDSRPSTKSPASKASTTSAKSTMSTVRTNTMSTTGTPPRPTPTRKPSLPQKPSLGSINAERKLSPEPARAGSRTGLSPLNPASPRSSTPTTANRPRAQVSDGVLSRRPSLGQKPAPPSTAKPAINRRATGTPSISSLKDIVEDSSVIEDLQTKLASERSLLEARSEELALLQRDLNDARDRLEEMTSEDVSKQASIDQLQKAKEHVEDQHATTQLAIEKLKTEVEEAETELGNIRAQLDAARADAVAKAEQVVLLGEEVADREKKWDETKLELERLKAASEEFASTVSASAAAEHEALLKTQTECDALNKDFEILTAAHDSAKAQLETRAKEYDAALTRADKLSAQVAELDAEKAENANRLSELEVEILELKEAAEKAEDEKNESLSCIKELEDQLVNAAAHSEQVAAESKNASVEHDRVLADVRNQHEAALQMASSEHDKLLEKLKKLEDDLATAIARHEESLSNATSAENAHAAKLSELERSHEQKTNELSTEMKRLADELANQEAHYAAKVDAVKAEHELLLQEAFENAKTEADNAHAQDLHALRTQSQGMIEELTVAHKAYIEEMKAEHNSILDAKIKTLEKTISSQSLELKATHDDLSKAKSSLAESTFEVESLRKQLQEIEKSATVGAASSASAAEVVRLTRELSAAHDEVSALKEVLNAQKDSISEMSNNHSSELESVAKARAEEVTNLRHEFEHINSALVKDRAALSMRVSDLEGELATLQASITAQADAPAARKSRGSWNSTVAREELQKLHDAHNLKMRDLEAQQEVTTKGLQQDLTIAIAKADDLQADVARRSMEIKYLESDVEEKDDMITRYKADIEQLTEELRKFNSGLLA